MGSRSCSYSLTEGFSVYYAVSAKTHRREIPTPDENYSLDETHDLRIHLVSNALIKVHEFSTVDADPLWSYANKASRGAADNHYRTMTVDEICRHPIADEAHG
jgi:hypothetical protein